MEATIINWLADIGTTGNGREKSLAIVDEFRTAVLDGRLRAGTVLPSERKLAKAIGISRGCLHKAFQQLELAGLIQSCGGDDKAVSSANLAVASIEKSPAAPIALSKYGSRLLTMRDQICLAAVRQRNQGSPPFDMLPLKIWKSISIQVAGECRNQMDSEDPFGLPRLRTAYAQYLNRSRGMQCSADQVIVFNAREARMHLIADVLLNAGDAVAVENPGFPTARTTFASRGAEIVCIPVDTRGLNIDHLSSLDRNIKLVHVTPSHQQPTGAVLSPLRRQQLFEWAKQRGALILEDDFDCEFRYSARRLPALSAVQSQSVIHMSCLWKVLNPLTTLGFLVVPPALVESFRHAKSALDPTVPFQKQLVLAEYIERGHLNRTIRKSKSIYLRRIDAVLKALNKYLKHHVSIAAECGGMDLMIKLHVDRTDDFVLEAARQCGLALLTSRPFYAEGKANDGEFIIVFSHLPEDRIDRTIAMFAAAVLDYQL